MTRRRRALLLAGLSLLLGGLAAAHVARREAALAQRIGPVVAVVVAGEPLAEGARLTPERLGVRSVPARYAPAGAFSRPEELLGLRAAVAVPTGGDVVAGVVSDGSEDRRPGAPVRPGERVADVLATASPRLVVPGARVDVLVTRTGQTELALEDVEVLDASAMPGGEGPGRVFASLRVTLRQAVFLAAAQSFARDIRLLARAVGDDETGDAGLAVSSALAG